MPSSTSFKAVGNVEVNAGHVHAIRSFNRFYTQRIGVLNASFGADLSLTEVRVLYELAHRTHPTASELGRDLALDPGYLSRILKRFDARGWLVRTPSPADARISLIALSTEGQAAFLPLETQSNTSAAASLESLPEGAQQDLVTAMATVQRLMAPAGQPAATRTVVLRDPQPGDMGWVVQQHGQIYAREYGWNTAFEALVADITAKFVRNFKPDTEKCWIAELDGVKVGAVFLVRQSAATCKLRMLILTPAARGLGLGGRLTDECIAFARSKGYKKMQLWTNSCLDAARAIYTQRGFVLTKSEPYQGFGKELVGETWELALQTPSASGKLF
ncbi:MAG: helix-turn-helix domain-containing GNAT family N-acetyltransferase [Pseudomonadota bacterium]